MLLYDSKYLKSLLKNILRSYDLHAGTADTMEVALFRGRLSSTILGRMAFY